MKKTAAAALTAVLATGVAACSSGVPPRPALGGGVSATCRLFWTYQSVGGIPDYPSFAAAYQADMAEYGHPSAPGYAYDIMPVLEPAVRITARARVNIGSIEVVFYDRSGDQTGRSYQLAVNMPRPRSPAIVQVVATPPTTLQTRGHGVIAMATGAIPTLIVLPGMPVAVRIGVTVSEGALNGPMSVT